MLNTKTTSSTQIEQIRKLLNQGKTQDALEFIEHLGQKTPVIENARGVCLMRLGKFEKAISVLREIVFQGYICMPSNIPVPYQINFATAMLLANQKDGAFSILNKLSEKDYPQSVPLKNAVRLWVKTLNIFEKCGYHLGLYPNKPIRIDFVPGEI